MFGRKPRVKCFNATYSAGSFAGSADLGYQVVLLDRIVGSVGRCQELDALFRPLQLTKERVRRLENIRRLAAQGVILPPIELYKLRDEYFVVDGNHRVAVAKENGQVFIDAHVVEFLPDGERAEDRLYLEQRAFAHDTGLDGIRISHLGGYDTLRHEIEAHRKTLPAQGEDDVGLVEAAQSWQRTVFAPVAQALREHRLPEQSGKTEADLYLELQVQRTLAQQQGGEMDWEEAIAHLAALYPRPTLGERFVGAWRRIIGGIEAWWHGLRAESLPCAYAQQAPDGTIYCRRAGQAKRGVFTR